MEAHEAAQLFKVWAAGKGLIQKERFSQDVDELIANTDFAPVATADAASVEILHNKGVSFVAFNDVDDKVLVFTNRRLTKKEREELPSDIDGCDIEYRQGGYGAAGAPPPPPIGVPPFALHNGRYTCGSSIHPANIVQAGTLGCLVRDGAGVLFGMSNNHIVGGCNFTQPNMPIFAPGPADAGPGGHDPFTIGYHDRLLPMMDGLPQNIVVSDNSDAALFRIRDDGMVSSMQRNAYDTPATLVVPTPNLEVEKVGRTTGLTRGIVRGQVTGPEHIRFTVAATGGALKIVFFDSLFIVEGTNGLFAAGGDSGSLLTTVDAAGERSAVAMVVGVNEQSGLCFVLPIGPILAAFNVTLVMGHNV